MIYLTLAVHIEEGERARARGDDRIPGMPLDLYDDEWKNAGR
jgi:hypothetical protein